jgi:hypothetical protein
MHHRHQLLGIVIGELEDVWRTRCIIVGNQHGIAVRRAMHRGIHANGAARANAIFDDDLLTDVT